MTAKPAPAQSIPISPTEAISEGRQLRDEPVVGQEQERAKTNSKPRDNDDTMRKKNRATAADLPLSHISFGGDGVRSGGHAEVLPEGERRSPDVAGRRDRAAGNSGNVRISLPRRGPVSAKPLVGQCA